MRKKGTTPSDLKESRVGFGPKNFVKMSANILVVSICEIVIKPA